MITRDQLRINNPNNISHTSTSKGRDNSNLFYLYGANYNALLREWYAIADVTNLPQSTVFMGWLRKSSERFRLDRQQEN